MTDPLIDDPSRTGATAPVRVRRPPLDPRLLRYAPGSRRYIVGSALFTVGGAVAIIVMALMVASIASELITDENARTFDAQAVSLGVLAAALAARVIMSYLHDRYAHRAAERVITELRLAAADSVTDPRITSPRELLGVREPALTVLLRGLDDLGPYLSGYLPALLSAVIITPVVVVVMAIADWPSALIVVVTIPLIPLFMILVGLMTRDRTERKLEVMGRLTSQLLDLIAGLPTLRALNRSKGPAGQVAALGEAHRKSTMSTLRVAFLSGAVLEMLATLCVALVAVGIGVRLVYGEMTLYAGLVALILAPEAYLPLRQIGAKFHDSEDGMTAADQAFELIEADTGSARPARPGGAPLPAGAPVIELVDLGITGRDGWAPRELTARFAPGAVSVLTGPNGSGKSSAVSAILGLLEPDEGAVRVAGRDLADLDLDDFRQRVTWLPQHPVVVPGSVADNLALFGDLEPQRLSEAAAAAGFDTVLTELPAGVETRIGADGTGLSAGQRQRLALTRTLATPASVVIADEPTAHLDDASADRVLAALAGRAADGATVIVIAHHDRALAVADTVTRLERWEP